MIAKQKTVGTRADILYPQRTGVPDQVNQAIEIPAALRQ